MAWLRAFGLVAAVAVLAGWSSPAHTGGPLLRDQRNAAGGLPLTGSSPTGIGVRFFERTLFAIDISFKNTSTEPVTVTGAQALLPSRSIVSQVGTRLVHWDPTPCPPNTIGCVIQSFFREPSASDRATPVTVQPGKGVGVQLDFRVGSCSAVPFASFAPVTAVTLSYGSGGQQTVDLGASTLRIVRPPDGACAPRPMSRLAIDGPFAASTASTTPSGDSKTCTRRPSGSLLCDDADRCSRSGAGILFRSGLFLHEDEIQVRVALQLPDFGGTGRYDAAGNVSVHVNIGEGVTYHAFAGFITVTRVTSRSLQGRLGATLTGFRKRPFHASGTWACTIAG
jgi:hypothetical protein